MNAAESTALVWMIIWTVCDPELCVTRIGTERFGALSVCESWLDENFPDNGEDVTAFCTTDPASRPDEDEEDCGDGDDTGDGDALPG